MIDEVYVISAVLFLMVAGLIAMLALGEKKRNRIEAAEQARATISGLKLGILADNKALPAMIDVLLKNCSVNLVQSAFTAEALTRFSSKNLDVLMLSGREAEKKGLLDAAVGTGIPVVLLGEQFPSCAARDKARDRHIPFVKFPPEIVANEDGSAGAALYRLNLWSSVAGVRGLRTGDRSHDRTCHTFVSYRNWCTERYSRRNRHD